MNNEDPARLTDASMARMREKLSVDHSEMLKDAPPDAVPLVRLPCKVVVALIDEVQESRKVFAAKPPTHVHHIAGAPLRIGPLLRQLCAWCGCCLMSYDLTETFTSDGKEPMPWPEGGIVLFGSSPGMSGGTVIERGEGADIPDPSCAFPTAPKKPALSLVR